MRETQIGPEDLAQSGGGTDGTLGDPDTVLTRAEMASSLLQEAASAPREDEEQLTTCSTSLPSRGAGEGTIHKHEKGAPLYLQNARGAVPGLCQASAPILPLLQGSQGPLPVRVRLQTPKKTHSPLKTPLHQHLSHTGSSPCSATTSRGLSEPPGQPAALARLS